MMDDTTRLKIINQVSVVIQEIMDEGMTDAAVRMGDKDPSQWRREYGPHKMAMRVHRVYEEHGVV